MANWIVRSGLTVALAGSLAQGCGDGSPTGTDGSLDRIAHLEYLTLEEFERYVADVQSTIPEVNVMIAEFASIANEFNRGFVPDYWIGAYTRNLLRRLDGIQANARRIRPTHPELLKLHTEEFEGAFADFHDGFTAFVQAVEQPGSVTVGDINDRIVDGNTHLIRLQILLSDLGGREVDFFGQGDGVFDDTGVPPGF